jgi:hypothetical protein
MKTLHLRKSSYFEVRPLYTFSWLAVGLFLAILAALIFAVPAK